MNQEMIDVPAGCSVSAFPNGVGTRDEIIRHLVADRDAWRIIAKQNDDWAKLPQSEKEIVLQKALDDAVSESEMVRDAVVKVLDASDSDTQETALDDLAEIIGYESGRQDQ